MIRQVQWRRGSWISVVGFSIKGGLFSYVRPAERIPGCDPLAQGPGAGARGPEGTEPQFQPSVFARRPASLRSNC